MVNDFKAEELIVEMAKESGDGHKNTKKNMGVLLPPWNTTLPGYFLAPNIVCKPPSTTFSLASRSFRS